MTRDVIWSGFRDLIWLGSNESLVSYLSLEGEIQKFGVQALLKDTNKIAALINDSDSEDNNDDDEDRVPYLYSTVDQVGIIDIKGTLVASSNWYNRFFNLVAYSDIKDALLYASQDESVSEVLLDIGSGGGTTLGVQDTAKAIVSLGGIKSVTAFTDSMMASAAMWLGSAASARYGTEDALVGSIGVIGTHTSYAESLKNEGVEVTLLRAGAYKALQHPAEKLSKKGKEDLQSKVDYYYSLFIDAIATNLNVPVDRVLADMADGREFIGKQAVQAGLLSNIASFENVLFQLQSRAAKKSTDTGGITMKKRYYTTGAMAAALASGVTPEVAIALESAVPADPEPQNIQAEALAPAATAEAAVEPVPEQAEAFVGPTLLESELVTYLKAELSVKSKEVVDATVKMQMNDAELTDLREAAVKLKGIAAKSIVNMQVALGGVAAEGLENLPAKDLLAQHALVLEAFTSKFKIGGVAAVSTEADPEKPALNITRLDRARISAVKGREVA